ncbi:hypothetical protein HYPSUDRAFT_40902 [Hypholoma sublateritium FD-334 SS-4]|uniref:Uncharacterized protein n=1 Tax=Hypholoma sublateritium (strain FD-334 SS-4) TaxID=945553 RepID=A0A0D2MFY0_HYPSF|nr:hypothetical protein HYPSUDRAFT_40902 [Hypholoma sublateritium FD-334 SS-4]
MSTQTITYDDRNTNALHYSGTWFLTGTWSDASGDSGTLSSTNDLSAYVSFVRIDLPLVL